MEADPVLAVVLAIMAAEAHLQQFKEAAQRSTFNWLVDALRDVLHRRRTEMRAPMSVERHVAVWWMANNMSYRAVAHQFGLARSTMAGIMVEVTRAITERQLERVVYLRDPDKVMTSTHLETWGLFDEVAGAMRSHGYRRTGEQLRAKFKREKAAFFDSLEDWCGIPPPRGYRPPSFSLLRELWEQGGRPGWRLRTPNHPVVVVSSSPDRSPASASEAESGEGQLPGPAPGPQHGDDRRRSPLERQMVEMRRTLKRHTYRLSFIQRSMVRLRQMVQRSRGIGQQQRQRRRQDPQQAPRPSSPMARVAEGGPAEQAGPPTGPAVEEVAGHESSLEEAEGPHQAIPGEEGSRGGRLR
ncbi:UNVERIFIED_CONTAM: hypothetical protein K2H54_058119 [Gekko kuhli]